MKRKRNPILPVKAVYLGEVSTPAELVAALKAAAVSAPPLCPACRGTAVEATL